MNDDNFDIYGDLDDALIEPLQAEVEKKAAEEQQKLKEDETFREETQKEISNLRTSNFQLKKNISLLLSTAKSEIERKDQQIKELRREMDEIIFRKNKNTSKRSCEKWTQTDISDCSRTRIESSRFQDKPKRETNDHRRERSPKGRYFDDNRRKEDNKYLKGRRFESNDRIRKSSHDKTRSKSPEKHDRYENNKSSQKESIHDDDLRKKLLRNKNEKPGYSSAKDDNIDKSRDKKKDKSNGYDEKKHKEITNDRNVEKDKNYEKSKSKSDKIEKSNKNDKKRTDSIDSKVKDVKDKVTSPKKSNKDAISNADSCETLKTIDNMNAEKIDEIEIVKQKEMVTKAEKEIIVNSCDAMMDENVIKTEQIESKIDEPTINVDEKPIDQIIKKPEAIDIKEKSVDLLEGPEFTEVTSLSVEIKEVTTSIVNDGDTHESNHNQSTESLNDSFESTKENSLNNSSESRKNKKRKIVTTEVESDGTVVWTIIRKKRKTKDAS